MSRARRPSRACSLPESDTRACLSGTATLEKPCPGRQPHRPPGSGAPPKDRRNPRRQASCAPGRPQLSVSLARPPGLAASAAARWAWPRSLEYSSLAAPATGGWRSPDRKPGASTATHLRTRGSLESSWRISGRSLSPVLPSSPPPLRMGGSPPVSSQPFIFASGFLVFLDRMTRCATVSLITESVTSLWPMNGRVALVKARSWQNFRGRNEKSRRFLSLPNVSLCREIS